MGKTLDARGLSCPQPVLITLSEIKAAKESELMIIVDNEASRENVSRALKNQGWTVAGIEQDGEESRIKAKKG
jgi:tRNA 2-thiouridine synthesizing protein A